MDKPDRQKQAEFHVDFTLSQRHIKHMNNGFNMHYEQTGFYMLRINYLKKGGLFKRLKDHSQRQQSKEISNYSEELKGCYCLLVVEKKFFFSLVTRNDSNNWCKSH